MDPQKALLVISITLVIVILLNVAIYVSIKRRNNRGGEIELFRRAFRRAKNPWGEEKANLEALSKQVAELQKDDHNGSISEDQ
jgi:hypothetical protein